MTASTVGRLPEGVTLVEVGPRDGLQSEDHVLAIADRVELVRRLVTSGATRLEVASFVPARIVPQMADAEAVVAGLGSAPPGVSYIGLVLNRRGLQRALDTSVDEVNLVVAASDGYSLSNQGASTEEALTSAEELASVARAAELAVSLTISVAFGDPFDGEVEPGRIGSMARRGVAAGVQEIALGDTIGVATPHAVAAVLDAVRSAAPEAALRCHFHNTRNSGLANLYAALLCGVTTFDTSVGGIGGSPFAPSAGGNVATEDAVFFLDRLGVAHGLAEEKVVATGAWLGERLGRVLPAAGQRVPSWP